MYKLYTFLKYNVFNLFCKFKLIIIFNHLSINFSNLSN